MRICSLLPSATEILYALGLGDSIVGVTFECDYPPEARKKPIVVESLLGHGLAPEEVDRRVSECAQSGESLYQVNVELMQELRPDLIVTQDLCGVCAVSAAHLLACVHGMSRKPGVISLTPHTLDDVWADIEAVGEATGTVDRARALTGELRMRIEAVKSRATRSAPRVACLEWLRPPFAAGHWVPEMIALAGGIYVLGSVGVESVRIGWEELIAARPDVVVIMPCGYDLEATVAEFHSAPLPEQWAALPAVQTGRVFAVNATAYFSRPGPRLVTGVQILAALLSDGGEEPAEAGCWTRLCSVATKA